jgi:hypothetical protein
VTFPLTLEQMEERLGTVALGEREVPVPAAEDLLLILAAHGAKHRWDRLEWICGISELLRAPRSLDWDTVQKRARSLASTRTLLLAVLVAHDLLDAPVPESLLREARADRWIVRLAADVQSRLDLQRAPTERVREMLSQNLFELPLQQRTADRFRFLFYRLTTPSNPDHWQTLSLGRRSFRLHALTWPLRLAGKLLKRPFVYLLRKGLGAARPAGRLGPSRG